MQMIRVPVTEEEFIVTFILELARKHARVHSVRAIADALRAERGIGRAEVLDYLARFAEEIKTVEPALQPAIDDLYEHIAAVRAKSGEMLS